MAKDAGCEGEPGVNWPPRLLRLPLTTSPSILTRSRRRQSSRGSSGRSGLGLKVLARLGLDLERGSCGCLESILAVGVDLELV